MKVSAQFEEVAVPVNEYGFISPLEKMTVPFSFDVDVCGVGAVQVVHDFAEVFFGCFYEQVIVVGHEDIAVKDIAELYLPFAEIIFEFPVIGFGEEYLAPLVATGCYMIMCAFIFYPDWTRHRVILLRSVEERLPDICLMSRADPYD
jgi:hypothetical protein